MPFDQGAPTFGAADAKVAVYNETDDYGTLTDVMSVQMAQTTLQFVNAVLNGDDQITATASALVGAQLQFRFGGLNPSMLAVITGKSVTSSASVNQLMFEGGERMPYFGFIVKALSAEVGDTWIFLPKCKIMSDFVIAQNEYGQFTTPEVTVQCVPDETWGLANVITHPTDVAITVMPPANIAPIS